MKKTKELYISISLVIIAFIFLFSIIFSLLNIFNSNIIYGIYINDLDVSNLSKEQAKSLLIQMSEEKKSSNFTINFLSKESNDVAYSSEFSFLPLNIDYSLSEAIENAYNFGRNGNIFQNNYNILKALIYKQNIELDFSLEENNLQQILDKISSEIPEKMIESSYYIDDGNLIILKGTSGNIIEKEELRYNIYSLIKNISLKENTMTAYLKKSSPSSIDIEQIHSEIFTNSANAYYEKEPFKVYPEVDGIDFDIETAKNILSEQKEEYIIPLTITKPEITINNLEINIFPDLLGSFSTKYDLQNENRATNLDLAASKINETVVAPGKQFSYNSVVGARTIATGYKESKIYSNGQVVDGIGGGICQISSTLYNAIVFANLEIKERHNHQFITSYVSPGRDATVVYGSKDLKFINNRSYPIKIIATASDGIVKVSIYGIRENTEYDVSFDTETISTIPYDTKYEYNQNLNSSKEYIKQLGANGAIVNVYKVEKLNGSIVSKTLISQDNYNALNRIVETNSLKDDQL